MLKKEKFALVIELQLDIGYSSGEEKGKVGKARKTWSSPRRERNLKAKKKSVQERPQEERGDPFRKILNHS